MDNARMDPTPVIRKTWHSFRPFAQSFSDLEHSPQEPTRRHTFDTASPRSSDAGPEFDHETSALLKRNPRERPPDYSHPPMAPHIEFKGCLELLGTFSLFWSERYFCVQADRLCWYKISRPCLFSCIYTSDDDFELEGDDSLAIRSVISVDFLADFQRRANCLHLRTSDPRMPDIYLAAYSPTDAEYWVTNLRAFTAYLRHEDQMAEQERALYNEVRSTHQHIPVFKAPGTPRRVCITGSYCVRDGSFPYSRHTRYWVTVTAFGLTVEHRYADFDALAARLRAAGWTPMDDNEEPVLPLSLSRPRHLLRSLKRLPRLPPKAFFNMRYKFVKDREQHLDKFIQRLVAGTDALLTPEDPLRLVNKKLTLSGQIIRDFFIPIEYQKSMLHETIEESDGSQKGESEHDHDRDVADEAGEQQHVHAVPVVPVLPAPVPVSMSIPEITIKSSVTPDNNNNNSNANASSESDNSKNSVSSTAEVRTTSDAPAVIFSPPNPPPKSDPPKSVESTQDFISAGTISGTVSPVPASSPTSSTKTSPKSGKATLSRATSPTSEKSWKNFSISASDSGSGNNEIDSVVKSNSPAFGPRDPSS
eukprot:TRINITY_DN7653_c0_g1::TRINITY_DN7653_c0_g1_i1::g.18656::m.18656 TRINITY_DN7653_c0_g1::TRINITY_DN7653_c0_g1_i1::g.18656  ORF type:complete len:589 (-),score=63.91,PX/PF00787.19/6.8e-05 TRINITY_DN7653_c0_g1_i1:428-2194(-)